MMEESQAAAALYIIQLLLERNVKTHTCVVRYITQNNIYDFGVGDRYPGVTGQRMRHL
jgi:hypothetical protein